MVDVVSDGYDELFQIAEDSTTDAVFGQVAKEPFDHVQPRCRGGREVYMEAPVFSEPALHRRVFVRGVVVADDVDLLFRSGGLVDPAQKSQPFLMAMLFLTQAVDLEVRIVANLEALDPMRLQSVSAPNAAHAGIGNVHRPCHGAARLLRGVGRSAPRGLSNHLGNRFRRDSRFAPGPRGIAQQSGDTQFQKPGTPACSHARRDLQFPGDLHNSRLAVSGSDRLGRIKCV